GVRGGRPERVPERSFAEDRDAKPEQPGDERVGEGEEQEGLLVERDRSGGIRGRRRLDEAALNEARDPDERQERDDDREPERGGPVVRARLAVATRDTALEC